MDIKLGFYILILCSFSSIAKSNKIPKSKTDIVSPNCKEIVCEQAHEQAKGLSKLALLDEFVSQTVFLLNDLMQNIDGELEKSANSLLRYVHPHCETTQKILMEVIEKQKEKNANTSPVLSQGIKPVTEESGEEHPPVIVNGHSQGHSQGHSHNTHFRNEDTDPIDFKKGDDDYSQKNYNYDTDDLREGQKFSNYDTSETINRKSGGVFVTKEIPKEDKFNSGWSGQKSDWREVDKDDYEEEKDNKWKGSKTWKSESTEHFSTQHKSREGKTIKTDSSTSSRIGGFTSQKVCRGVDKGSAFWVPGLDQWCLENCSKGYCPKTHCIC